MFVVYIHCVYGFQVFSLFFWQKKTHSREERWPGERVKIKDWTGCMRMLCVWLDVWQEEGWDSAHLLLCVNQWWKIWSLDQNCSKNRHKISKSGNKNQSIPWIIFWKEKKRWGRRISFAPYFPPWCCIAMHVSIWSGRSKRQRFVFFFLADASAPSFNPLVILLIPGFAPDALLADSAAVCSPAHMCVPSCDALVSLFRPVTCIFVDAADAALRTHGERVEEGGKCYTLASFTIRYRAFNSSHSLEKIEVKRHTPKCLWLKERPSFGFILIQYSIRGPLFSRWGSNTHSSHPTEWDGTDENECYE